MRSKIKDAVKNGDIAFLTELLAATQSPSDKIEFMRAIEQDDLTSLKFKEKNPEWKFAGYGAGTTLPANDGPYRYEMDLIDDKYERIPLRGSYNKMLQFLKAEFANLSLDTAHLHLNDRFPSQAEVMGVNSREGILRFLHKYSSSTLAGEMASLLPSQRGAEWLRIPKDHADNTNNNSSDQQPKKGSAEYRAALFERMQEEKTAYEASQSAQPTVGILKLIKGPRVNTPHNGPYIELHVKTEHGESSMLCCIATVETLFKVAQEASGKRGNQYTGGASEEWSGPCDEVIGTLKARAAYSNSTFIRGHYYIDPQLIEAIQNAITGINFHHSLKL